MNAPSEKKLTGITNELAKERNREAAERTLTSWIQNCIPVIGFGMAFDRIISASNRTFSDRPFGLSQQVAHIGGLIASALEVSLLLFAVFSYLKTIKSLEQEDLRPNPLFYPISIGAVVLYGFITGLLIFLTP